mgnify:CR=1 FL=1
MKYIVILGDGMSDEPLAELGNKTPLMVARKPHMDYMAKKSEIGLVNTIPEGMSPGSDTANLSVLGYNPKKYYSGRSPLEALSVGVDMKDTDISLRCNLVTLSDDDLPYEKKKIIDHSSSEISTADADVLIEAIRREMDNDIYKFYTGTSYRHLMIWDHGKIVDLAQPHDILDKTIGEYLPQDNNFRKMMVKSYDILNNHPINKQRKAKGLNKANSIWFWGAGTKPALDLFEEKYKKKGAMISAVDLLKGIAVGTGMKVVEVPGANGTLHTNYEGKANAATKVLLEEGYDFVYVHVEAPDEMGHQGNVKNKIKAIENLDEKVVRIIFENMQKSGEDFRILIMPDHPTPISIRTHTADPVPYMIYDSRTDMDKSWGYDEEQASLSGNLIKEGHTVINSLFETN